MGKYLDKFKSGLQKLDSKANEAINNKRNKSITTKKGRVLQKKDEVIAEGITEGFGDEFREDSGEDSNYDPYDEVGIQPSQKPESFHHFILENQYKDLERSIRGFKEIFDKESQKWRTVRKKEHCFTDEEAEEILRAAQSHLATDIKLSFINKDSFGAMMIAIYKRIDELFYSISEYRYGRYGSYQKQYEMKLQNRKIFLEFWVRVQANYSRAIQGQENKYTHDSVKGQESLKTTDNDSYGERRYS